VKSGGKGLIQKTKGVDAQLFPERSVASPSWEGRRGVREERFAGGGGPRGRKGENQGCESRGVRQRKFQDVNHTQWKTYYLEGVERDEQLHKEARPRGLTLTKSGQSVSSGRGGVLERRGN